MFKFLNISTIKPILLVSTILSLVGCASTMTITDRGNFGEFQRSLNNTSYGYEVSEDVTGSAPTAAIEVFDVRPGDCAGSGSWSDCKKDRERSELSERKKTTKVGDEYWYGWSIYFPEDYTNVYPTKVALGQFHQQDSHPVWMFQNSDGGYHLDDQVFGHTRKYYELVPEWDLRGKWHKVEIHANWATDRTGFFRVWVNGERKVNYTGPTMDSKVTYFKYGVYRSFLSRYKLRYDADEVPAQKVYYSNVKRGNSRESIQAD